MPMSYDESLRSPLRTAAEVEERVQDLVGAALVNKVWLLFLDEDDVQLPVIIPIGELPERPPEEDALVPLLTAIGESAHSVIAVLERPGGRKLSGDDRAWVRSLSAGVHRAGLGLSGLLLSHSTGVRSLSPDDWI
jgi:hypothetical protein